VAELSRQLQQLHGNSPDQAENLSVRRICHLG